MEKRLSTLRGLCQLQDSSYAAPDTSSRLLSALTSNRFFLSRTVAAEVLLECTENVGAYNALNTLAGEGHLQFDLPYALYLFSAEDADFTSTEPSWWT